MFDELRSESKRCLVLLATFVLVMPLGCSTPDWGMLPVEISR